MCSCLSRSCSQNLPHSTRFSPPQALFTKMSSRSTRAAKASTSDGSVKSHRTAMPSPPALVTSSAVSSIVSARPTSDCWSRVVRPPTNTVAPTAPNSTAMARPAPRVAPVTTATFPLRSGSLLRDTSSSPSLVPGEDDHPVALDGERHDLGDVEPEQVDLLGLRLPAGAVEQVLQVDVLVGPELGGAADLRVARLRHRGRRRVAVQR